MSQQSYQTAFVAATGTLLASGSTVENLAVAQLAILDGNTHVATTTPTYAKNKALEIVLGTPDLGDLPLMSGQVNQNMYSKLIKGKNITKFTGKAASRPQTEVWTVGWSGDDADTDTLFAKPGEVKTLYVKLTGGPIDKAFTKQGVTRQFSVQAPLTDDCGDPCVDVDCRLLADDIAKQINSDPFIGFNSFSNKNKYIKVSTLVSCETPPTIDSDTDYVFQLSVCDTKDDYALGTVQAQYASDIVKRTSIVGSNSIYEIVRDTNSLPTAFSNAGVVVIPDCGECPSGYSLALDGQFVYTVTRADAGTSGALVTVKSDYAIAGSDESGARTQYEFGTSTYVLVSDVALTVSGVDTLIFRGITRSTCVISSPTTVAWAASGTLTKFGKNFLLTIHDTECGESRLTELQAAYPDLTVAAVSEAGANCVRTYSTTVFSQAVEEGCSQDQLIFIKPDAFEGIEWQEDATLTGATCKCGLRFEVAYVNRQTNECTFDYFPYEYDAVHIQLSTFNPDYNASPSELTWVVKKVRGVKFPSGSGAFVREQEKKSKGYYLNERTFDPVVREIYQQSFTANPAKYYDEYTLYFEFSYKVGGWSQNYTDSYALHLFFEEGTGKAFESAINGYLASSAVQVDPVIL